MSNKYPILRNVTKIKLGQDKFKYSFKYTWKNGKPITDDVYIQRINKLSIPPAYKNVNIFSPTSKIQYTALDDKQRVQKGYHPVWIQERNRKKFRYLTEFVTAYPKIVKKINTLLPSSGIPTTKEQMVGLAAGLLDVCRIRPGSDKHLRDTGSYGTTTLCKKHVAKKTKNGKTYISLKFVGKSGVTNECILKYNTKIAKNLYNLSEILINNFNSKVPNKFEDLIKLPGVGRKTANVVLNEAFNKPTIAVDTHVFRVSNRTGLAKGKYPDQVEIQLLKILPKQHLKKAHHLILLHGRYTCKSRNPLCKKCVINKICLYKGKNE